MSASSSTPSTSAAAPATAAGRWRAQRSHRRAALDRRVQAPLLPGRPPKADWAGPWARANNPESAVTDVRAICCSGGGIRAAAFALGGLQYLTTRADGDGTVYGKTDLVTSVSGGGYTAGSFALVQHHLDQGTPPAYAPGTPEDNRLRAHTRYLADSKTQLTMSLMGILYGLALNLLAILAAVVLLATLVGVTLGRHGLDALRVDGRSLSAHIPNGLVTVIIGILVAGIAVYVVYRIADTYSPRNSAVAKRWSVASMLLIGAAGVAALLLLGVPHLLAALNDVRKGAADTHVGVRTGTLAGTVTALVGIVAQLIRSYVPAKSSGSADPVTAAVIKTSRPLLTRISNRLLPWIGSLVIIAGLTVVLLTWVSVIVLGADTTEWGLVGGCAAFLPGWKLITDSNRTSLHRVYTQRLAAAFGVRRDGASCDNEDDRLSRYADRNEDHPELVICATVNTDQPGSTPSGRNCAPFTFSAHTAGISSGTMFNQTASRAVDASPAFDLRARETSGRDRRDWNANALATSRWPSRLVAPPRLWMDATTFEGHAHGPTIMDLVAVSGAAVSPAMGRVSRPSLRLLLGVANVRLGMWLPNPLYGRRIKSPYASDKRRPQHLGRKVWRQLTQPGLVFLFREIVAGLTLKRRWVYVTDGGHYENLGLVEALRRGATDIIVFDASGDTPFSLATFGQAVETARADLGVEIELETNGLAQEGTSGRARRLAVRARATYANGVVARIYLCKAAMVAGLPHDIVSWQGEHRDFPNTSTADQLYGDREFEAYRKLGWCAAEQACDLRETPPVADAETQTFGPTGLHDGADLRTPTARPRRTITQLLAISLHLARSSQGTSSDARSLGPGRARLDRARNRTRPGPSG